MDLRALVGKHYRDQVNPEDLLDIKLMQESYTFLDELTQLLDIGSIYNFQKIKFRLRYCHAMESP